MRWSGATRSESFVMVSGYMVFSFSSVLVGQYCAGFPYHRSGVGNSHEVGGRPGLDRPVCGTEGGGREQAGFETRCRFSLPKSGTGELDG